MNIEIISFSPEYTSEAINIWNEVIEEGVAFPQLDYLNEENGKAFFEEQSFTGLAIDTDNNKILGLYILHPNNVGRCGHICNASYAVLPECRGQHIGEMLVKDCMQQARAAGYKILQFNAVVASNKTALNLYKKLGFTQLGLIPGGFRNIDNVYEDIIPHYITL